MLKIKGLTKVYKSNIIALNQLDLTLEKGTITCLLGHNGAGKTTALKIIATVLPPASGDVYIDSIQLSTATEKELQKIKREIGFLSESPYLISKLTPYEYLFYIGQLYGNKDELFLNERIQCMCKLFHIEQSGEQLIEEFSSGMKKRIAMTAALMNNPKLLLLDEPTNNLDPVGVKIFKSYMLKLKNDGCTILIATHNLDVAEKIADYIAVLEDGVLIYHGTIKELKNTYDSSNSIDSLESLYSILTEESQI